MLKRMLLPLLPALFLLLFLHLAQPPVQGAVSTPFDVTPLPPVTTADGRLGVCYGFYEEPVDSGERPYLDLMVAAGARHDRWDFNWSAIQAGGQEEWNLAGHERIVRAENQKGVDVLGMLLFTPDWASTCSEARAARPTPQTTSHFYPDPHPSRAPTLASPAGGHNCPPQNLDQPVFVGGEINPQNYWGNFVYHVVRHFDGVSLGDPALRVNAWEIWNEPDWDLQWTPSPTGTLDYCRLLQVAYTAIKGDGTAAGANPDATVLFGGLHYWADPEFYPGVLDCLAEADPGGTAHNYFFDVMSLHFYSRGDQAYHQVNSVKSALTARGMGSHPIWLTESGAPLYGDASPGQTPLEKHDFYLSLDEQAAYVIQSYANGLAAGVERYYFFRPHDYDMWEPFGLIRNDRTLRPAYVTYQVAATYLQGENQVTRVQTGDATRVSLWGTPRGKVSVLWNRAPMPISYTLASAMPTAELADRWGAARTIHAVSGYYTLTLPGATANLISNPAEYIVGGEPYLLIESDPHPPVLDLVPLPAITFGSAITLTWTAADVGSGFWYAQVQASSGPEGPWTTIASWPETVGANQAVTHGALGQTIYFRARARDRVGNWEPWPARCEVSTTVGTVARLHWQADALYNDSNRNGQWDRDPPAPSTPEVALTDVSMRLADAAGRTVTSTVGSAWHFTATLPTGAYTFVATWRDPDGGRWLGAESVELDGTTDPLHAPDQPVLGLLPHQEIFLPLLRSNP